MSRLQWTYSVMCGGPACITQLNFWHLIDVFIQSDLQWWQLDQITWELALKHDHFNMRIVGASVEHACVTHLL